MSMNDGMQGQMQAMRQRDREMIPPVLLWGMLGVVLITLALVTTSVLTGRPHEGQPTWAPITAEALVSFERVDGAVHVTEADGTMAVLDGRSAGFIDTYVAALSRKRMLAKVDPALPVRVIAMEDGRIVLVDPETGWRVYPRSFGDDSQGVFAKYLPRAGRG